MYTIEKRYINTNSMTKAAAQAYYGKPYVITDYFTHWWGLPAQRAKSPMDIYNYMKANNKSVRHILGWDDALKKVRIIAMTPEDRVPLTQQNANIYGDSVEVDPLITTSDPRAKELYKALGWLMWQREKRWGRRLRPRLHKEVWATACSNISKTRVQQECDKWRSGGYNEVVMLTKNQVRDLFVHFYGRGPSDTEYAKYVGKATYEKLRANMLASTKFAGLLQLAKAGKLNPVSHLTTPLKRAYVAPPTPGLTVLPPGKYEFKA